MEIFQPDTCILKCKERAHNFYYVLSGVLEVKDEDDNKLRHLRRGNTFGVESVFCDFPQVSQCIPRGPSRAQQASGPPGSLKGAALRTDDTGC